MKILVTGNLGYIGSVLCEQLSKEGYDVIGYDIGYYKDNLVTEVNQPKNQIIRDLRDLNYEYLEGVDSVIHLCFIDRFSRSH